MNAPRRPDMAPSNFAPGQTSGPGQVNAPGQAAAPPHDAWAAAAARLPGQAHALVGFGTITPIGNSLQVTYAGDGQVPGGAVPGGGQLSGQKQLSGQQQLSGQPTPGGVVQAGGGSASGEVRAPA